MLIAAALTPSPERADAVVRAWSQLNGAGPTLRSSERQAVIFDARRAWAGVKEPNADHGLLGEAAHWVAVDAEGISLDLIASLEARGLDRLRYLEVVGVVARLSNIDWYVRAIGAETLPLPFSDVPLPDAVDATGNVHPEARITDSWVPMLDLASAPRTLDALPDEGDALRDLHEPMYIDMADIVNWSVSDELTRSQIEYLAARVSYLNECFY